MIPIEENPKRYKEKTRIVVTVFSRKKEPVYKTKGQKGHYLFDKKRGGYVHFGAHDKKIKGGWTRQGVSREGFRFRKYEFHVNSTKAFKKLEELKKTVVPRLKNSEKVSVIAQAYRGKMDRRTGKWISKSGQVDKIVRSVTAKGRKVTKRTKKGLKSEKIVFPTTQWSRAKAKQGFEDVEGYLRDRYEYLIDEHNVDPDELFEEEEEE